MGFFWGGGLFEISEFCNTHKVPFPDRQKHGKSLPNTQNVVHPAFGSVPPLINPE